MLPIATTVATLDPDTAANSADAATPANPSPPGQCPTREVVKRTPQLNAGAVIFAHNHPSGVCEPSRADELLTQALKQAIALVDVRVLDHFVVAGSRTVSFAERGLL